MIKTIDWLHLKPPSFVLGQCCDNEFNLILQKKSWSEVVDHKFTGDLVGSRILLTPGTWHSDHRGDTLGFAILDWLTFMRLHFMGLFLHNNLGLRFS